MTHEIDSVNLLFEPIVRDKNKKSNLNSRKNSSQVKQKSKNNSNKSKSKLNENICETENILIQEIRKENEEVEDTFKALRNMNVI